MAQPEPKLQRLSDASQTSIHALLHAIDPVGVDTGPDGKLTSNIVTKLSEKLSELVGPEVIESFKQDRNERGELVNEEGLPIIDITELVHENQSQTTETLPTSIVKEPFSPLSSLPPSVRARRNEQVNRILNYLEEEECQEELKGKQRELEERNDILQKRKTQEAEEKANIKATKELQKKMGRALLQNIGKEKEKERQEQEVQRLQDEEVDKGRSPSAKKKTVAFADVLDSSENNVADLEPSKTLDWGDVTLARLRASKRPTLLSQSLLDKHPMKMSVVERFPACPPTLPSSPHPRQKFADSDDESDPMPESDSSDTAAGDENDDQSIVLEQDEVDFDFVQHQRQIALDYHRKRSTFGQVTAETIMNPFYADDAHLESTPDATKESSKPAVSQFRASHIASAYNASKSTPAASTSTSFGASIVPASSSRTIQRALRTGKLDSDGRLVGGEVDSASEDEDPALQEVLELLKKGEIYNLGPDGSYIHTIPPRSSSWTTSTATLSSNEPSATKSLPPSRRAQISKFKPSRPAEGRLFPSGPVAILNPSSMSATHKPLSTSITPTSHTGRSSPKLEISQTTAPQVYEQKPLSGAVSSSSSFVTGRSAALQFSIVDSPSFPVPQDPQGRPDVALTAIPYPSVPICNKTRPDRPPAVLSSAVMQSNRSQVPQSNDTSQQAAKAEKKISRFKAERL